MNKLIFRGGAGQKFWSEMLADNLETAAIVLARPVTTPSQDYRLLVDEVVTVPAEAYVRRTGDSIVLTPEFLALVIKRARHEKYSIIMAHTHPWDGDVRASAIDLHGEETLLPTLFRRVPGIPHGRLILGPRGYDSMIRLGLEDEERPLRLFDVGPDVQLMPETTTDFNADETFDRQVRAFGQEGQRKIESLRVAIVGLGGTGSVVAQQLAHLGCRDFLLIDPDLLELTNLNRVVGSAAKDVGRPKVDVAGDMIRRIRPSAKVEKAQESALITSSVKRLLDADIFFCCTDSHGSRAVLTQFAYQYLVPGFDLGVQIEAKGGTVSHITGRVQMLAPGLACLVCADLLNPEAVRVDLMTESQRRADPYIVGTAETQPAVVSLNSTVASLAVTMYLSAVAGIPAKAHHQVYRAEVGVVRSISNEPFPKCVVCSPEGAFGRGDSWPTPGRPQ